MKVPGLGTFRIAFKSAGVSDLADFNVSAMIKEPRILFTPEKGLRESVINNLTYENGGVLKDGVRYASVADYRLAMGEASDSGSSSGGSSSGSGNDDGNNPL